MVLVHGGGDEVSALQAALGGSTTFVERPARHDGAATSTSCAWRSRGARTSGSSRALVESGIDAVGLSGEDAALIAATPMDAEQLGLRRRAGDDQRRVPRHLLSRRLSAGDLAGEPRRERHDGSALNVNGDDAAAAIAVALGATELLLVADVAGVMRDGAVVSDRSRRTPHAQLIDRRNGRRRHAGQAAGRRRGARRRRAARSHLRHRARSTDSSRGTIVMRHRLGDRS